MIILAISTGTHDMAATVLDEYRVLSAIQTERLSRVKNDGAFDKLPNTINEALRVARKTHADVDVLAVSRCCFEAVHFILSPPKKLKRFNRKLRDFIRKLRGRDAKRVELCSMYIRGGHLDYRRVLDTDAVLKSLGLPAGTEFFDYNHHLAHALAALFFTEHQNALIYTADGGGDAVFYSMRHIKDGNLITLYGGDEEILTPSPVDSVGQAYGHMTRALGYKMNRHEGKLTGLAAYGKPKLLPQLKTHFRVTESGRIDSNFKNYRAMRKRIFALAATVSPEDAAASIQQLLEDLITQSVQIYLDRTGSRHLCLAGGVFANVALNRRLAELPGVDSVFIFPAMGDEGLPVGGALDYLLRRDGLEVWNKQRRPLSTPLWGGDFTDEAAALFNNQAKKCGEGAEFAAKLLAEHSIVAIYDGRMEFGPRALGARSILANPAHDAINKTLNARLHRTEFMPFAPYVLESDADDVFEITDANRYAMKFMTITCEVREKWRDKISAVVHIDGTARPQIISTDDPNHLLYAEVLQHFKRMTGLPVLVNTSFNAHEEPIIYTPQECLRALNDGRVDYVLLGSGVYAAVDGGGDGDG